MTSGRPDSRSQPAVRRSPKADWQLADLIDFEFLLEKDRDLAASALSERDHRWYREIMANHDPSRPRKPAWNRRWLFRRWLEWRREQVAADQVLPGGVFASAWRVINEALAVLGVLAGAGLAANLLRYDGVQPVNVAAFLGWLVLAQLGLVVIAVLVFLLRRSGSFFSEISFLTGLMRWIWSRLALALSRHATNGLSADRRLELQSFFGRIAGRRSQFGEAALWPLVAALQWFGICFNAGAILVTVLLVVFSDRAFGWQSAVDFQSTQIHAFVTLLAQPWTWAWPEGVPTLEQVMGSKIVLKDGIKQLATEDLVSWWPFLCLALVTYGLLPRVALWLWALGMGYGARQRVSFRHVACDRLYERMTAPHVRSSGPGAATARSEAAPDGSSPRQAAALAAAPVEPPRPAILLIPEDQTQALALDAGVWREEIAARFPWRLAEVVPWPASSTDREEILRDMPRRVSRLGMDSSAPGLILLEESWQPPIAEKLQTLRELPRTLGEDTRVMVLLIGRPRGEAFLTPPDAGEAGVWGRHVAALSDERIRLEPWTAP